MIYAHILDKKDLLYINENIMVLKQFRIILPLD